MDVRILLEAPADRQVELLRRRLGRKLVARARRQRHRHPREVQRLQAVGHQRALAGEGPDAAGDDVEQRHALGAGVHQRDRGLAADRLARHQVGLARGPAGVLQLVFRLPQPQAEAAAHAGDVEVVDPDPQRHRHAAVSKTVVIADEAGAVDEQGGGPGQLGHHHARGGRLDRGVAPADSAQETALGRRRRAPARRSGRTAHLRPSHRRWRGRIEQVAPEHRVGPEGPAAAGVDGVEHQPVLRRDLAGRGGGRRGILEQSRTQQERRQHDAGC